MDKSVCKGKFDISGRQRSGQSIPVDFLLQRDKIDLNTPDISAAYKDRSVLVTGAGGSIGAELARQVLNTKARALVLYDHSEYALYKIEQELRPIAAESKVKLVAVLGSVTDPVLARSVMGAENVDIVLHAAAYKHVPLLENNAVIGVRNNVFGTKIFAEAASHCQVGRFLLISTDKAVRPTNIMGASKRLAELVLQDMQTRTDTTVFSMVRFGNVLDSSGSVIPLFRDQIIAGGPLTLTHAEMTRFFMTIPEATRLVLLASTFAKGGEVFALDMGPPVRIFDLAQRLVHLSGLTIRDAENPEGDIELKIIGLRPGEKLHEERLMEEMPIRTSHSKIRRTKECNYSELEIARMLCRLSGAVEKNNSAAVISVIEQWVDGFKRSGQALHEAV